jgi:hypothetical protein
VAVVEQAQTPDVEAELVAVEAAPLAEYVEGASREARRGRRDAERQLAAAVRVIAPEF